MSEPHNPVIEDYRKTLAALHRLLERKEQEGATEKQLRVVREEIDEVSHTLAHLQKGEKRWKWELE